mmetsp:Transcript_10880/g.47104  ORF Transcript_10880/g.47104 Transcript_10880/m.47104 type:complete len:747 (-) Transcript_10880:2193-4433(-)
MARGHVRSHHRPAAAHRQRRLRLGESHRAHRLRRGRLGGDVPDGLGDGFRVGLGERGGRRARTLGDGQRRRRRFRRGASGGSQALSRGSFSRLPIRSLRYRGVILDDAARQPRALRPARASVAAFDHERVLVDVVQHGVSGGDAHGRLRERRRRRGGVVKLTARRARLERRQLTLLILVVILARRLDGGFRGRHRVEQIQRRVQRIPVEVALKVRGVERHERGASAAGASLGANCGFPRDPHDVRGGERFRRARKPRQPHHVYVRVVRESLGRRRDRPRPGDVHGDPLDERGVFQRGTARRRVPRRFGPDPSRPRRLPGDDRDAQDVQPHDAVIQDRVLAVQGRVPAVPSNHAHERHRGLPHVEARVVREGILVLPGIVSRRRSRDDVRRRRPQIFEDDLDPRVARVHPATPRDLGHRAGHGRVRRAADARRGDVYHRQTRLALQRVVVPRGERGAAARVGSNPSGQVEPLGVDGEKVGARIAAHGRRGEDPRVRQRDGRASKVPTAMCSVDDGPRRGHRSVGEHPLAVHRLPPLNVRERPLSAARRLPQERHRRLKHGGRGAVHHHGRRLRRRAAADSRPRLPTPVRPHPRDNLSRGRAERHGRDRRTRRRRRARQRVIPRQRGEGGERFSRASDRFGRRGQRDPRRRHVNLDRRALGRDVFDDANRVIRLLRAVIAWVGPARVDGEVRARLNGSVRVETRGTVVRPPRPAQREPAAAAFRQYRHGDPARVGVGVGVARAPRLVR